jgi:hypothetical protein
MKLFFLDDARQNSPSRPGMRRLIAAGGISLLGERVGEVERALHLLCRNQYGFPPGEEFKWSPGRRLWMRDNLVREARLHFYRDVIRIMAEADAKATVVVEDCQYNRATDAHTAEMDVVRMCLERVCNQCSENPSEGLVFTDLSMGGLSDEDKFLEGCLQSIQSGYGYIRPKALALNVVSTSSKFIRLLQVADIVTSATLAAVAGEYTFSVPVVEELKAIYRKEFGVIGGRGVKIHPDSKYVNLYHWLFGDELFKRLNTGYPLPMKSRPYANDPNVP